MELWIRSQDKKSLVKAGVIYICNKTEIVCSRALEVLDEIQNLMTPKIRFSSIISTKKLEKYKSEFIPSNLIIVYEMPKE